MCRKITQRKEFGSFTKSPPCQDPFGVPAQKETCFWVGGGGEVVWWFVCLFVCLLACLPACLPACLLAFCLGG